ncbi:peptide-methionine (S)-S-oxide reductase MsrA [Cognatishimia activa]|uniref:peptide-methionine (S)-S-oxide reductase MsrA n=1 Tax=Cognatishimia activa TaxID=1715691 RepID=UPI00222EC632|nr:peptide-methionine (S)-S-oxide reductase MsrA [Cognatishimia activa]UZD90698.1 peptide-methionine (S)-S-oxide reductase MsrA [Cognatishimia activa]
MDRMVNLKTLMLGGLIAVGVLLQCTQAKAGTEKLIVAGGCFWCVESDFESVNGVKSAVSGYIGGSAETADYKKISKGGTGHYEAVEITFDNNKVSRDQLLHMFFRSVDPTDAGGQFCDRGDSYRTAVFYKNNAQKSSADSAKAAAQSALGQKIVTPVLAAGNFYKAEKYHQDYYKSSTVVLTRFGPKKKSEAYKRYREACGRDQRVKQLWGKAAPFASK